MPLSGAAAQGEIFEGDFSYENRGCFAFLRRKHPAIHIYYNIEPAPVTSLSASGTDHNRFLL
jgi:hypothetical protein